MKVETGGTRLLPAVGWAAQPALGLSTQRALLPFPHPFSYILFTQDRLALLVQLPFIRDGRQGSLEVGLFLVS